MNVILLDNVENLGKIGDLVKVKPGYGRNYLLPQGKAALATKANLAEVEARRAELEKAAAEELAAAKSRAELIDGMELVKQPQKVGSVLRLALHSMYKFYDWKSKLGCAIVHWSDNLHFYFFCRPDWCRRR